MDREKFTSLLLEIVNNAQELIKLKVDSKTYISTYFEYPELKEHNPFPQFNISMFNKGPKEYSDLFSNSKENSLNLYEVCGVADLVKEIDGNEYLCSIFKNEKATKTLSSFLKDLGFFEFTLKDIINKSILTFGFSKLSYEQIKSITDPIYNWVFEDFLDYDIHVPILFIQFDFDKIENEKYSIVRMSDDLQKARANALKNQINVNKYVGYSATHSFVIKAQSMENKRNSRFFGTEIIDYPTDIITENLAQRLA